MERANLVGGMAKGTRMKQLEVWLDTMDLGLRQTQEEVSLGRVESTATREAVQALDQGMKEELSRLHMGIANVNQ